MKKTLLILILLSFSIKGFGQEIKVGQRFILKAPAKHSKTDLKILGIYDTINKNPNYLDTGIKYKIVEVVKKKIPL